MIKNSVNEAREKLSRKVLRARTPAEIAVAEKELKEWLVHHPEETGMRKGFEQLAKLREINEIKAESGQPIRSVSLFANIKTTLLTKLIRR
jgi:hypothetical protein